MLFERTVVYAAKPVAGRHALGDHARPFTNRQAMLEILFLIGVFGLGLVTTAEYVCHLDALPTLLVGALFVPVLFRAFYATTLTRYGLERLAIPNRRPVPPERFYWDLRRARLRARALGLSLLAGGAWTVALRCPASLATDARSIAGWLAGALAIVATAEGAACGLIYFRASEWLDGTRSRWSAGCRRVLSRVSGDRELLDPEPLPGTPERQRRARSIY